VENFRNRKKGLASAKRERYKPGLDAVQRAAENVGGSWTSISMRRDAQVAVRKEPAWQFTELSLYVSKHSKR
jgi:hypothetical protein